MVRIDTRELGYSVGQAMERVAKQKGFLDGLRLFSCTKTKVAPVQEMMEIGKLLERMKEKKVLESLVAVPILPDDITDSIREREPEVQQETIREEQSLAKSPAYVSLSLLVSKSAESLVSRSITELDHALPIPSQSLASHLADIKSQLLRWCSCNELEVDDSKRQQPVFLVSLAKANTTSKSWVCIKC